MIFKEGRGKIKWGSWWALQSSESLQEQWIKIKMCLRTQTLKNQREGFRNNLKPALDDPRNTLTNPISKIERFCYANNGAGSKGNRRASREMRSCVVWRSFGQASIIAAEQWRNSELDGFVWTWWWGCWKWSSGLRKWTSVGGSPRCSKQ